MSRTLLLLGGSEQQIVAIDKARELGYRTVLCDYLPDNPGQHHADVFYQVSTTDMDAVLEVARTERIDGVVAYASDPAAPTAAYVADVLGLPGVPLSTADSFCQKHLFRRFLSEHGFNVPWSVALSADETAWGEVVASLSFPLLIKPTDSSGSKGVTVVFDAKGLSQAAKEARRFSRNGVLIAEEFVERAHPHVIEAEIFVLDGEVACWGLINSIRDVGSNPLLPAGYSYPLDMDERRRSIVRAEVGRLVEASGVQAGAFNIEMIIDKDDRLFFLDAGPRNGGNMLPDFISMIAGCDLVEATVRVAMGDGDDLCVGLDGTSGGSWGLCVLHSARAGRFGRVDYSDLAASSVVRERLDIAEGDEVRPFETCNDLLGLSFMHFRSEEEKHAVMDHMAENVHIVLEGEVDADGR